MNEPEHATRSRLDGLTSAVEAGAQYLDEQITADAAALVAHGAERLKMSGEHTIVALGGATGSGKSSLFNVISDLELAGTGVRRPTTSWALACAWGPDGAGELLEWMGIPQRHQVSRVGMLDRSSEDTRLDGLVLIDLPDHDSTEVSHQVEMERLVPYCDLLVWVLDPQKYADAAIHERYIQPMAAQADAMIVVLNKLDQIPFDQRDAAIDDLHKIMNRSGLSQVPVFAVSSTRGDGIDELKRMLAGRIRERTQARQRLDATVGERAGELADVAGVSEVPGVNEHDRQALVDGLADAVGIEDVVSAHARSQRRRGLRWVVWLPLTWLPSSHGVSELTGSEPAKSQSAPEPAVHEASAEQAVRTLADTASVGLKRPWAEAVQRVSTDRSGQITAKLAETVSALGIRGRRVPVWWYVATVVQWLLFAAFVCGIGWAVVDLVAGGEPGSFAGLALPWLLAIVGLAGGIIAAVAGLLALLIVSHRYAKRAGYELRASVSDLAEQEVLNPVSDVLDAYSAFRSGLRLALDDRARPDVE